MEVAYMASLLKKKARKYELEELTNIFTKAKMTLKVLIRNMISGDVPLSKIMEKYNDVNR